MMNARQIACALAPAALLLVNVSASAQDPSRMEQIAKAETEAGGFMGSVLVAKGDEILIDRGFGSANLEWEIANSSTTKFRIGSVTKQFTAASILLLQERGLLEIEQPVKTYWPSAPEAWDKVTVRHLLHHTSGIPNITDFDDFGTVKYLPTTRDDLIARFASKDLEFAPGSEWKYSNSGYLLLSAIVEEVSGEDYESFVTANILGPLGMDNTAIDSSARIVPLRASGYTPSEVGVVNAEYVNMTIPQGAGAFISTTGDLLKWQRGLFGGQVLSPASLAAYITPVNLAARGDTKYGLGVFVEPSDSGTAIWHGGGIEGFNAYLAHDPGADITVAVLANLNGGAAVTLGQALLTLARGGEVSLPSETLAIEVADDALAEYVGTYAASEQFRMAITRDGDGLKAQLAGQQAFDIFPESTDVFFFKVVEATLSFERGDDGAIDAVTLRQGGNEITAARE